MEYNSHRRNRSLRAARYMPPVFFSIRKEWKRVPQDAILQLIGQYGLVWFFAIVLLVPVTLLFLAWAVKKVLGLDFTKFMQNQRDEIEADLKVVNKLEELSTRLSDMAEAMWGNRDYTDRKVYEVQTHFDAQNAVMIAKLERIQEQISVLLTLAKKRQSDWLRDSEEKA
jgi:hypothetical protein